MATTFDVIVIGLGAMGSASAWHLAQKGKRVLGLDRFVPPHAFGSSHGQTRIIREAYFEHPIYVPLLQRAYQLWSQLAKESETELFLQTGGLMIGRTDGVVVGGARRSAELHHLPHENLSAAEIRTRFPGLRPSDDMVGVWEPRAGILFPEKCICAHLQRAQDNGATLHFDEPALTWKPEGQQVRVTTAKGDYSAAQLVLSAGSWIQSLLPGLDLSFTVERQVLFWFDPRVPALFQKDRCPIHLWEHAPGKFFYGFPDLGNGVKLARHHEGEIIRPEVVRRDVDEREVEGIRTLARTFLPEADGPLREATVCLYTNTPDHHFFIDRHPTLPQVLIVSPCSGHGFKFSSVIGEIVSELTLGGTSRFDLSLFRKRAS
jgi:sarcosine oxidase